MYTNPPQIVLSPERPRGPRALIHPTYLPLLATLTVLAVVFIAGGLTFDRFLSPKTLVDLLGDNSFVGVAAIGSTIVILSGGIDLSVGAVVAFSTIFMATMIGEHGWHPLVAAGVTIAIGTSFGVLLGTLVALFDLPAFMVTLSGMFFARAMAFVVHEASLGIDHPFLSVTLRALAWHVTDVAGRRRPIPVNLEPTAIIMLALFAASTVVMHFTSFGRDVYAVGGDEQSARLLGVRVTRTKISVYALGGFFSALAGIVATIYKGSGDPASFYGLELDAIAAVVVGGTLLSGGRGFVIGTLLGVLLLGLIQTFINFSGKLRPEDTRMFVAALMLAFILMQGGFNSFGRWLGRSEQAV